MRYQFFDSTSVWPSSTVYGSGSGAVAHGSGASQLFSIIFTVLTHILSMPGVENLQDEKIESGG